jgi:hypothetical protein
VNPLEHFVQERFYSTRRAVQPGPVPARIHRALRPQFKPLGFREVRVSPTQTSFFVVEKDVATRAIAKRERGRLDRVVFGDLEVPNAPRRLMLLPELRGDVLEPVEIRLILLAHLLRGLGRSGSGSCGGCRARGYRTGGSGCGGSRRGGTAA